LTCTCLLSGTSDGDFLSPLLLFKYAYKDKNGKTPEYPKKYEKWQNLTKPFMAKFNNSGFTNGEIMVKWIEKIIVPFETEKQKVLVLDDADQHKTEAVKKCCVKHNIELLIIPGGCTYFMQPIDVSINKPFKDKLKAQYSNWLTRVILKLDQSETTTEAGYLRAPTYEDVVDWTLKAMKEIDCQIVKNAFIISGLTFGMNKMAHLTKKLDEEFRELVNK